MESDKKEINPIISEKQMRETFDRLFFREAKEREVKSQNGIFN
jgi:hypothetical protein